MKRRAYSSLAAFLAHYRALSAAARSGVARPTTLGGGERELLAAMEDALAALSPEERMALLAESGESAVARRRARAELKLRRVLVARALLQA